MRYGSVCSGVEAASVAWTPLGWQPSFFAEIEPFANAVLAHRYPEVPNLGDFTRIGPDAGPIDLLVGGTPCQGFSVAGLRKGLDDDRSNLALQFIRLADRLRPRWLVWENVPGVFSTNDGRDFGTFLGGLAECGYGFAYRVLDAQYVGLAQRRKRVFLVGYLGDWRPPAAVLFERESLSGHPAPCRETGEKPAFSLTASVRKSGDGHGNAWNSNYVTGDGVANTVTSAYHKNGGAPGGKHGATPVNLVAHTLTSNYGKQLDNSDRNGGPPNLVYQCQGSNVGEMGTLRSGNGYVTGGVPFVADTLGANTGRNHIEQAYLAHALASEGADASEDGTGRRVPLVAFSAKDYGNDAGELAPTLRALAHAASHANGGGQVAIAFSVNQRREGRLRAVHGCLGVEPSATQVDGVVDGVSVRRLTPLECERLQGFPDDWTLVPYRGKPASDGPRYRAIGNAMAVTCMGWIGRRIALVDSMLAVNTVAAETHQRALAAGKGRD